MFRFRIATELQNQSNCRTGGHLLKYNQQQRAGVVQWQNGSFPSFL